LETVTVNQFRDSLREHVEKVLSDHEPPKVTCGNRGAFVVAAAEDREHEQETSPADGSEILIVMAPAPPRTMKGAGTMTVSLTPAIPQGERGTWSACGATCTVRRSPP
jgi:hypothetical protein